MRFRASCVMGGVRCSRERLKGSRERLKSAAAHARAASSMWLRACGCSSSGWVM